MLVIQNAFNVEPNIIVLQLISRKLANTDSASGHSSCNAIPSKTDHFKTRHVK